jgi:two-component system sensor histidine kinase KdpD
MRVPTNFSGRWRVRVVWQYATIFVVVLGLTLALYAIRPYLADANVSLLYLLVVLFCAAVTQPGVTLFCGVWSFLCYDFLLIPPAFALQPESPLQLLDPLTFLVVALVAGALAERSRQHASLIAVYREAEQFRATLLHLVSHNLRTPLAVIKTALTSLLDMPTLSGEGRQLLLDANQEADHLNRLINNVLRLSRLEAHALQLHEDWNALDEVISVVLARWPRATSDGVLSARVSPTLPLVRFDFDLIEAALTNLVDNALRYGHPPVQVTAQECADEIWISVQDAGPGVPEPDRARLFTRFSSTTSKGIGLGLAVCKGLIEAHGGRVWAEFSPGQTRFTLALPFKPYSDDGATHDSPADSGR